MCLCISQRGADWDEGRKQGGRPPVDMKTRDVKASIWEHVKGKVVRGGTIKVKVGSWVLTLLPPVRWKERIIR